jgi:hypothetical protein
VANYAGASGLMQVGIGGAAGDEYDELRHFLPNPALGPHDPLTSVQLAALVLIKHKNAPTNKPIDAYLTSVIAYNGSGSQADAYGARVIADAHSYQGNGTSSFVSYGGGCSQSVSTDTGWGNGNGWVSYQLTGGKYAGDYIYVAEGITPTVQVGEVLAPGQQIGTFNGHSIEIGFANDGQSDAALAHTIYSEGADTAAGRAMNDLLTSLGAPGGHQDMGDCNGPCPIVGGPVPAVSTTAVV